MKEGTSEDGVRIYDGDDRHIVKFKDKEAFLKLCLQELRNGSVSDVKYWIDMCKECWFNYPEFEVIEKSIRAL